MCLNPPRIGYVQTNTRKVTIGKNGFHCLLHTSMDDAVCSCPVFLLVDRYCITGTASYMQCKFVQKTAVRATTKSWTGIICSKKLCATYSTIPPNDPVTTGQTPFARSVRYRSPAHQLNRYPAQWLATNTVRLHGQAPSDQPVDRIVIVLAWTS